MSTGIHLVMPMAGSGSRFYNQGYNIPKPLIEIKEKPFFTGQQNLLENLLH